MRRPGGLGRAHEPLRLPGPARVRVPGRDDRRRGGRGVRQGRQPAGPGLSRRARRSSERPATGTLAPFAFPRSFLHDDRAGLQLLGAEDGRPVRPPRARTSSEGAVRALARDGRRPRGQLPGGRRGRPGRQDAPGAREDRPQAAGRRGRRGRQQPVSRAAGGDGRRVAASSCSSRPCRSAPTTPPWRASPWPSWPRARWPSSTSTSPPGWSARDARGDG